MIQVWPKSSDFQSCNDKGERCQGDTDPAATHKRESLPPGGFPPACRAAWFSSNSELKITSFFFFVTGKYPGRAATLSGPVAAPSPAARCHCPSAAAKKAKFTSRESRDSISHCASKSSSSDKHARPQAHQPLCSSQPPQGPRP